MSKALELQLLIKNLKYRKSLVVVPLGYWERQMVQLAKHFRGNSWFATCAIIVCALLYPKLILPSTAVPVHEGLYLWWWLGGRFSCVNQWCCVEIVVNQFQLVSKLLTFVWLQKKILEMACPSNVAVQIPCAEDLW